MTKNFLYRKKSYEKGGRGVSCMQKQVTYVRGFLGKFLSNKLKVVVQ